MGKENTLFSQSPSAAIGSKHSCSDVTHLKTFAFKGISGDRRLPHLDEFHEFFWGFFLLSFFLLPGRAHGLRLYDFPEPSAG